MYFGLITFDAFLTSDGVFRDEGIQVQEGYCLHYIDLMSGRSQQVISKEYTRNHSVVVII